MFEKDYGDGQGSEIGSGLLMTMAFQFDYLLIILETKRLFYQATICLTICDAGVNINFRHRKQP